MLTGLSKYSMLLGELVKRDIKVKYKGSVLGIIWSVLNPLLMMLVMSVVFSLVFRFNIPHYIVYLITGQVFFSFMVESTTLSMHSILGNGALLRKIYVPKYIFPISKVLSALVNLGFNMVSVLVITAISGVVYSWSLLLIPVAALYILIFSMGLGLVLSTIVVFFRDIQHIYGVFTLAWTYFTPIFYELKHIPEKYQAIFQLNPMYHFINYFRSIVLHQQSLIDYMKDPTHSVTVYQLPGIQENALCLGIAVLMLLIGLLVFRWKQYKFLNYV